ncbi:MAG: hypothetical protein E7415_01505 [Ruminococcaceae bacterium]|nr:hypothetical protein [Oscillospiraceae bacterium]
MKKRILAMVLALTMVFTLVSISASAVTIKEAIEQYGQDKGLSGAALERWLTRDVEVPLTMEVKEAETDNWAESVTVRERKDTTIPDFDFRATLDMSVVEAKFNELVAAALVAINAKGANPDDLETISVAGTFDITIKLPDGITIPAAVESGSNMDGFNDEAKEIFEEVSRSVAANEATISIKVKDNQTKASLKDVIGNNITFTVEGVEIATFGTYVVEGTLSGSTVIGGDIATINYVTVPTGDVKSETENYDAVKVVAKKTSSGSTGGGSGTTTKKEYTVEFVVDGKTYTSETTENGEINLDGIVPAEKEGYEFEGWYTDKELTKPATSPLKVTANTKLYAKYVVKGTGEGPVLNVEDHGAYIIGYTDGTVRPLNNIVREEVATIFFRLLTEEAGEAMHKEVAPYSDVPATRWSSTAIATLANGGYITGRPDGTFGPSDYITRAEFATIAARFTKATENTGIEFSDVENHWAKNYIEACAASGLITGYTDGTFKPDQYITRAEAMAIVNRMLNRAVDAEGLKDVADDVYYFGDNVENTWCYYIVLEATNSHDYTRAEDGKETWTSVTEVRDWVKYEK